MTPEKQLKMEQFSIREETKKILAKLAILAGIFILVSLFLEMAPEGPPKHLQKRTTLAVLERIGDKPPPDLSAEGILARRLRTGEIILAKNESKIFAIASLAKLMTAMLFIEKVGSMEFVPLSLEAKNVLEPDEKKSKVKAGEAVKAEDLLMLTIAESDNDASYAAADETVLRENPALSALSFPERIAEFVFLMNNRREALGLRNTHFMNPGGRDNLLNYSTAEDLFLLSREIYYSFPAIWNVSRIIEGEIFSKEGTAYSFQNTNELLKEFPALSGSKTGFTDQAGEALLMLYNLAPRDPIVVVILKSQDRFGDGRAILRWLEESFEVSLK